MAPYGFPYSRKCSYWNGSVSKDLMYSGYENSLIMSQKFRVAYPCQMDILYFPFDEQHCKFILKMETKGNQSVILKTDATKESVSYNGPRLLQEFELVDIR